MVYLSIRIFYKFNWYKMSHLWFFFQQCNAIFFLYKGFVQANRLALQYERQYENNGNIKLHTLTQTIGKFKYASIENQ